MSVIIPVFNEGASVAPILKLISESIDFEHEILVVYDHDDDTTLPTLQMLNSENERVIPVKNQLGSGPAKAIRSGLGQARSPVIAAN